MQTSPACKIRLVAGIIALLLCPTLHAQKQPKQSLTVTSLSYRAVPWQNTTYLHTQGRSDTDCYGSGTDYGYGSTVNVNCTTVTTPSQAYPMTISKMFVYNQVRSGEMIYTIACTANWVGSHCVPLDPGNSFSAEINGRTMWVEANIGKKSARIKYEILDFGTMPDEHAAASVSAAPNVTAPSSTPAATQPTPIPSRSPKLGPVVLVCLAGQSTVELMRGEASGEAAGAMLPCGTRVKVLAQGDKFAEVLTGDYVKGFVALENVMAADPEN